MEASYLDEDLLEACSGAETVDVNAQRFGSRTAIASPTAQYTLHPYACSNRLISTLLAEEAAFVDEAAVDEAALGLERWIRLLRETDLGFNHLLKNDLALLLYAISRRSWRVQRRRLDRYERTLESQLLEDGGHAERTPMYHNQVLADLLCLIPLAAELGLPTERLNTIAKQMSEVGIATSFTSGRYPLFGDSWLGTLKNVSQPAPYGMKDRPGVTSAPDFGVTMISTGDLEIAFSVGSYGDRENPAHGHDDALAMEIECSGSLVIADYGVSSYSRSEERLQSRSSAMHNGPSAIGKPSSIEFGAFRVGRRYISRPSTLDLESSTIVASVSPYWAPDVLYTRSISPHDGRVTFLDRVDNYEEPWRVRLIFACPNASVEHDTVTQKLEGHGEIRLVLDDGVLTSTRGIYFRQYGVPSIGTYVDLLPRLGSGSLRWSLNPSG